MSQYFPEPKFLLSKSYTRFMYLCNKADLKNAAGIDKSKIA